MRANGVHALPVVDARGRPVRMLTSTDLLREVAPTLPVARVMSPRMISIAQSQGVGTAARKMRALEFHHLVVTHRGKVTGMLSAFDLLDAIDPPDDPAPIAKTGKKISTRRPAVQPRPGPA